MKVLGAILVLALKTVVTLLVVALPLLGVWVASSLAAYANGPLWLSICAGALLFPGLPLAWDFWAERRRAKKRHAMDREERVLTFFDRLLLRTLALNLAFLILILALNPKSAFTALSTRGDWFLDRTDATWKPGARAVVFSLADRLEWLYELADDNPFEEDDSEEPAPDASTAPDTRRPPPKPSPSKGPSPAPDDDEPAPDPPPARPTTPYWPMSKELHPAVTSLPASALTSIQSLADHLKSVESNPVLLVKALHDWVAANIAYDAPNYVAGRYPPQDAETVFRTKLAVCAGYSKLLVALGEATGIKIVYVVGHSRDMGGNVSGQGHAWNAVQLGDNWYLIDSTWNAGYVNGSTFTRKYSSDYLFAPPEVFGSNHLPENPRWQLRNDPISRGDFMRQPNLRPRFYAQGLELLSPQRSQVTVHDGWFTTRIKNTRGAQLYGFVKHKGGTERADCTTTPREGRGVEQQVRCRTAGGSTYHVQLFVGEPGSRTSWYSGQFEVNSR